MEEQNISKNFLGTGWSFPPTFGKVAKNVEMTSGEVDIDRSLKILLTTHLGERVMLPEYGCNMEDLLYEPIDTGLQTLLFDRVETAILYFEPRIEVEELEIDASQSQKGMIIIKIVYRVRATNSRFNFVFPFYKTEGSQVNNP
jgi:phage baseplate assembly protein W